MSNGRGKHKSRGKRRAKVTSAGSAIGARRTQLSEVQKQLISGAATRRLIHKRAVAQKGGN